MSTQSNVLLDLDLEDNTIKLELTVSQPRQYNFVDEYDLDVITKVSNESKIAISDVMTKGLFLELQELGVVINYEDECEIVEQIAEFCDLLD
jgi:hypothetical protein